MEWEHNFKNYLENEGKSQNTIEGYTRNVQEYMKWFEDSFGKEFYSLLRPNILDYKTLLYKVMKLNGKTVNHKISSLRKFNAYLVYEKIQDTIVIEKGDMIRVQKQYASPAEVTEAEVKNFLQRLLEVKNSRNYAIAILFAYAGPRISETLAIEMDDFNITTGECVMRTTKGEKQRVINLNSKVVNAIKEYLKDREGYKAALESSYLFVSQKGNQLSRYQVNRVFNKIDDKITPHQLRHFFCSNALEKGMSLHEVAYQAGHSSFQTTMGYTNPEKRKIKEKMEGL